MHGKGRFVHRLLEFFLESRRRGPTPLHDRRELPIMALFPRPRCEFAVPRIADLCDYLDRLAPAALAEAWDNTGLLAGDAERPAERVMTCLTITPETAEEAIEEHADLIISHHPLPFRPLQQITTASTTGRLLWDLIGARISIYSPHTRFDSADGGINQEWARRLGLLEIRPLLPAAGETPHAGGSGRIGRLPRALSLREWTERLRAEFPHARLEGVAIPERPLRTVAVACGSGGSLLAAAIAQGCDAFVTGEIGFHHALECRARSVHLLLVGHYASERFAVEWLAERLQQAFPDGVIWASRREDDPLCSL